MLLFTILKVIGLVLLFLLLLILLLLALVLLVPIRYAGAGHKGEEKSDYAAHVDVSWLLHIVQLHAGLTPAGLAYYLRILCFRPLDSRPPDIPPANASDEASLRSEEVSSEDDATANVSDEGSSRSEETTPDDAVSKDSDEAPSENEADASPDDTAVDASDGFALQDEHTDVELKQPPEDEKILKESVNVPESKPEASERAAAQTAEVDSIELKSSTEPAVQTEEKLTSEEVPGSDETDDMSTDETDQESETKSETAAAEAPKKKKRKKSSFADRIKRICEKLSALREAVEDEENQKAFRLLLSRVKYLLHHLRFRRFEGRLVFGFDDPAMMGRILGVLSLFYPLYGESFTITPVFDHTAFEGEVALKGHVRLIHILIAGIQLMMNKKIRGLVLDRI